jgi:hypothetical protein
MQILAILTLMRPSFVKILVGGNCSLNSRAIFSSFLIFSSSIQPFKVAMQNEKMKRHNHTKSSAIVPNPFGCMGVSFITQNCPATIDPSTILPFTAFT